MALEDAPNKDGAKMLSSDSDAYDAALQTAEASLFRIYDPLLFIPFDIRDNCTADAVFCRHSDNLYEPFRRTDECQSHTAAFDLCVAVS